jgi:hypothetical protein
MILALVHALYRMADRQNHVWDKLLIHIFHVIKLPLLIKDSIEAGAV